MHSSTDTRSYPVLFILLCNLRRRWGVISRPAIKKFLEKVVPQPSFSTLTPFQISVHPHNLLPAQSQISLFALVSDSRKKSFVFKRGVPRGLLPAVIPIHNLAPSDGYTDTERWPFLQKPNVAWKLLRALIHIRTCALSQLKTFIELSAFLFCCTRLDLVFLF